MVLFKGNFRTNPKISWSFAIFALIIAVIWFIMYLSVEDESSKVGAIIGMVVFILVALGFGIYGQIVNNSLINSEQRQHLLQSNTQNTHTTFQGRYDQLTRDDSTPTPTRPPPGPGARSGLRAIPTPRRPNIDELVNMPPIDLQNLWNSNPRFYTEFFDSLTQTDRNRFNPRQFAVISPTMVEQDSRTHGDPSRIPAHIRARINAADESEITGIGGETSGSPAPTYRSYVPPDHTGVDTSGQVRSPRPILPGYDTAVETPRRVGRGGPSNPVAIPRRPPPQTPRVGIPSPGSYNSATAAAINNAIYGSSPGSFGSDNAIAAVNAARGSPPGYNPPPPPTGSPPPGPGVGSGLSAIPPPGGRGRPNDAIARRQNRQLNPRAIPPPGTGAVAYRQPPPGPGQYGGYNVPLGLKSLFKTKPNRYDPF